MREDALTILKAHYERQGVELNEARLRMARIPDGAELIDNPVSSAPGFRLGNVYVMAGVPSIFQAMVQSVLPSFTGGLPISERNVSRRARRRGYRRRTGRLGESLSRCVNGILSFSKDGVYGTNLVLRSSDRVRLAAAKEDLIKRVQYDT